MNTPSFVSILVGGIYGMCDDTRSLSVSGINGGRNNVYTLSLVSILVGGMYGMHEVDG